MIEIFRQSLKFKKNKYHIRLSWEFEKISYVPSNNSVAIRVLDHVARRLERDELYRDYLQVFSQQKRHVLIEGIFVTPHRLKEYIWIPHRSVLNVDPTSILKVRSVFTFSLKTNTCTSLN